MGFLAKENIVKLHTKQFNDVREVPNPHWVYLGTAALLTFVTMTGSILCGDLFQNLCLQHIAGGYNSYFLSYYRDVLYISTSKKAYTRPRKRLVQTIPQRWFIVVFKSKLRIYSSCTEVAKALFAVII